MNISLIGMPGSGKSRVGKILARDLGFEFFDSDEAIEKEFGMPLPVFLKERGEKFFLQKEEETVISHTRGKDCLVISPGGSIIYSRKAMKHLKNISLIIYLKSELSTIKKRIKNVPRGIVSDKTNNIADLYAQRVPLYQKWGQITVDADQSADQVAKKILYLINRAIT